MYLDGSLAIGDFDPGKSDLDFVVVTDGELPPGMTPEEHRYHATHSS